MKVKNKIMDNDLAALYMGIYGLLIQIIAFAVIYSLSNFIKTDSVESTATTLVYLWYLFPIFALIPLTLAILQIRQRKAEGRPFKKPIAGLLVNAVWILASIVFLAMGFGFAQQSGDKIDLEKMTAGEILNVLTEQGYPMVTKNEFNDKGDLNEYPWNLDGCTNAVQWKIPDDSELGAGGGTIEVYGTATACKMRRDGKMMISSFYPAEPYYVQVEKVFLEVPQTLTQQEAAQYQAALQAMAQGKLPEPFTDGTRVNDYKDNQASAIEEAIIIASMPGIFTDKTKIGEVEGIPVYKEELELIAAHFKSLGKENPYKDAMEHLKKYKHVEKLAIQYGITVSDEEISAYIDQQRDIFDDSANDPEMTKLLKDYYAALQMTEDEYWTIYEPIDAKRLYYKSKVDAYMESKGILDISNDDIEYTINDAEYRDKIEGK